MTDAASDSTTGPAVGERLRLQAQGFHRAIGGIRELLDVVSPHIETDSARFMSTLDGMSHRQKYSALIFVLASSNRTDKSSDEEGEQSEPNLKVDTTGSRAAPIAGRALPLPPTLDDAPQPDAGLAPVSDRLDAAAPQDDQEPSPHQTEEDSGSEAGQDTVASIPDLESLHELAKKGELDLNDLEELIQREFKDAPTLFAKFAWKFHGQLFAPSKRALLNNSMLVTAVSIFEATLASIFSMQFHTFPALIDASERKFSLADLKEFDSIEDATESAIEDRVDSLMRESFTDWEDWFKKRAGVVLADLCIDRDSLVEVIQRRHLLVHTGGRVSRQYLERVSATEPPVGTVLHVSAEYLNDALDSLDVLGVALGMTVAAAWDPDTKSKAVRELNNMSVSLIDQERHKAARKICDVGGSLGDGSDWFDHALRVNAWIASKQLHGPESIEGGVSAWNVSALSPEFQLAKLALLDEHEKVFELLPKLIESTDISFAAVESEWPLFKELRDHDAFPAFLEKHRPAESSNAGESSGETNSQVEAPS